jgi:membrane fusion protein (multidrug efflux system)
MKRNFALLVIMVLWGLASLVGCGQDQTAATPKKEEAKARTVRVEVLKPQSISRILETTGEVVATNMVTLSAMVEGPIVFCPWREGDRVNAAGQKLIEIDRALFREEVNAAAAALAVAQARLVDLKAGTRPEEIAQAEENVKKLQEALAFSKTDLERIARLVERGGLPGEAVEKARVNFVDLQSQLASAQQRLDMLKTGPTKTAIAVQEAVVKEAETRLELAKKKVAEGMIAAPFAGVVTKVYVRPGDLATLKTPLLEISDPSSLVIRFTVPEAESGMRLASLPVQVALDAYPDQRFQGKIIRVYPEIDRKIRTQILEAKLTQPANLLAGMFARVRVILESVPNALVVPTDSILTSPKGDSVVMVAQEGKAVRSKVKLGIVQGDRAQIVEGLQAGQQVIWAGHEGLKDGAPIQIAGEEKRGTSGGKKGEGKS